MLKPTRTILALAAGSLALGLVGAGTAVAADHPAPQAPAAATALHEDDEDGFGRDEEDSERRRARGIVISHGPLTVRNRPTTHSHKVGKVHPRQKLVIECKTRGERVDGNNIWFLLADEDRRESMNDDRTGAGAAKPAAAGSDAKAVKDRDDRWVAARYVKNLDKVRYCRS